MNVNTLLFHFVLVFRFLFHCLHFSNRYFLFFLRSTIIYFINVIYFWVSLKLVLRKKCCCYLDFDWLAFRILFQIPFLKLKFTIFNNCDLIKKKKLYFLCFYLKIIHASTSIKFKNLKKIGRLFDSSLKNMKVFKRNAMHTYIGKMLHHLLFLEWDYMFCTMKKFFKRLIEK